MLNSTWIQIRIADDCKVNRYKKIKIDEIDTSCDPSISLIFSQWKHIPCQDVMVFQKIFAFVHLPAWCLTHRPCCLFDKWPFYCLVWTENKLTNHDLTGQLRRADMVRSMKFQHMCFTTWKSQFWTTTSRLHSILEIGKDRFYISLTLFWQFSENRITIHIWYILKPNYLFKKKKKKA